VPKDGTGSVDRGSAVESGSRVVVVELDVDPVKGLEGSGNEKED